MAACRRERRGLSAGLALGLALLAHAARPSDAFAEPSTDGALLRVDGTVATLSLGGGRAPIVILRSDLELRARLKLASTSSDASEARIRDAALRDVYAECVREALLAAEAQRVQLAPPSRAMIEASARMLLDSVGGATRLDALLASVDAEQGEIDRIVEQRAWIAAFLDANLPPGSDLDEALAGWTRTLLDRTRVLVSPSWTRLIPNDVAMEYDE